MSKSNEESLYWSETSIRRRYDGLSFRAVKNLRDFPAPILLGSRRYYPIAEVLAWEEAQRSQKGA